MTTETYIKEQLLISRYKMKEKTIKAFKWWGIATAILFVIYINGVISRGLILDPIPQFLGVAVWTFPLFLYKYFKKEKQEVKKK